MSKKTRSNDRKRARTSPAFRALKWAALAAVVALIVYVLSQGAGVAYDEDDIGVVNFSDLSPAARRSALQSANRARCTCGCGMNLAQCVATDMTCPVRERNIEAIRAMVREAGQS